MTNEKTGYGMLMTSLPSKNAAAKIARKLVGEKLAACVQLYGMESFYRWQGEIVNAPETLLMIKTRLALFDTAIARIKELHPGSLPEIVGTAFMAGLPAYFSWIDESTTVKEVKKKPEAPKGKKSGQVSARASTRVKTGLIQRMRRK